MFTAPLLDYKRTTTGSVVPNILCEQYKPISISAMITTTSENNAISLGRQGAWDGALCVRNTAYTDAASFKTAVSGVKLVYELATPVQFPLAAPTIPTPTGTATTWAKAEDGTVESMEVTYVGKA